MTPAVLVTGGAKRLGEAIVRRFAAGGWHVIVHYHSSADAAERLANLLPSAETLRCDLADEDALRAVVQALAQSHADWRALVNCASVFKPDSVTGLDPMTNRQSIQVNARSPAMLAQHFLRHATAAGPRCVIDVTDQKLANMNPDFFSYTMAKAALAACNRMLSQAFPDDRVHMLAPGAILPSHDQDEDEAERSHRRNLLGRRTSAEEVAEAAWFLATGPLATGQSLYVDSGQHLCDQPRDVIYLERGQR